MLNHYWSNPTITLEYDGFHQADTISDSEIMDHHLHPHIESLLVSVKQLNYDAKKIPQRWRVHSKHLWVPSIFLESLEALNIEKSEESWLLPPESKQEQLLIDLLLMLGCFGILWILIWSCELHACQINSWAKVPFLCVALCNNEILKDMQATMQKVVSSAKD